MKQVFPALVVMLFASLASANESGYPQHWWEPVHDPKAPSWEVLPQDAGPGEVILSKRNELGLLSNFAATPFEYRGKRYASVEGLWQSLLYPESPNDERAKLPYPHTRAQVEQMVAFEAKDAGGPAKENMKKLGIDWVTFEGKKMLYRNPQKGEHYELIRAVMKAKLEQNPEVMKVLLKTGSLKLRPDHHVEPDANPAWRYFDIWMELRGELK